MESIKGVHWGVCGLSFNNSFLERISSLGTQFFFPYKLGTGFHYNYLFLLSTWMLPSPFMFFFFFVFLIFCLLKLLKICSSVVLCLFSPCYSVTITCSFPLFFFFNCCLVESFQFQLLNWDLKKKTSLVLILKVFKIIKYEERYITRVCNKNIKA
jgi:hypothetical protein